eukprot:TsM_001190200 transcript=TsM_001190200 gene=TsM_001190200
MVVHAVCGELASSNAALATYTWVPERLETAQHKHIALTTAIRAVLVIEVVELAEVGRSPNRAQAIDTELEARMAGFLVTVLICTAPPLVRLSKSARKVVITRGGKEGNRVKAKAGAGANDGVSSMAGRRGVKSSQVPQFHLHFVEEVSVSYSVIDRIGDDEDAQSAFSVDGVSSSLTNVGVKVRELATSLGTDRTASAETDCMAYFHVYNAHFGGTDIEDIGHFAI